MNFFNNFIPLEYKKNIGITGITDAFFSVYLYNLLEKENRNILVVVNSLSEANNLYSYVNNLTDNEIRISFSAKYMLDALKTFDSENVLVLLNGEIKPIIIKEKENGELTQLILPIKTY